MPDIPGLPALITMLFTPFMELRSARHRLFAAHLEGSIMVKPMLKNVFIVCSTNKERTCYTGALCGLGWNSQTQEGILPEHDIELTFDVKFDVEDITEVTERQRDRCDVTDWSDEVKCRSFIGCIFVFDRLFALSLLKSSHLFFSLMLSFLSHYLKC